MLKDIILENGLEHLIRAPKVDKILPKNSHNVRIKVVNAMTDNKKILIVPDIDVDGIHSARAWDYGFKRLRYTNYEVYKLEKRVHTISLMNIETYLERGFKVFLIVDSSSNDMILIKKILDYSNDTEVIIIDHHNCKYSYKDYPERCTIVNPMMETPDVPYYKCSAGYLNALIVGYILAGYQITDTQELNILGYISMYTDTCDCSNPFIIGSMVGCFNAILNIPKQVELFMNDYSVLNKNFIQWTYGPAINALGRMNRFDLIDELFFHLDELPDLADLKRRISEVVKEARALKEEIVSKHITTKVIGQNNDLIWITLDSELPEHYYNFQGLIANQFARQNNTAAVCAHFDVNTKQYYGSARDSKNRDLLSGFSSYFEESQGHNSAFGVVISKDRMQLIPSILESSKKSSKVQRIEIDYNDLLNDSEITTIARYNEFCITDIPIIALKLVIGGRFAISSTASMFKAETKGLIIESIGKPIERNSVVTCIPQYNGKRVVCVVE